MARIRSIHPGLFTDEAFMSASAHARLLMIGLWTEAWDDGAFEWKPIVIKARIFPADSCDVAALLAELASLNILKKVERAGKSYGLIRNFRRFQRPKKPNSSGVVLQSDVDYLGPAYESSEPIPNQFETGSEKSPQMEGGGGIKEKNSISSLRSDIPHALENSLQAVIEKPLKPKPSPSKSNFDFDEEIDERLIEDWKAVRKAKKAGPITQTVMVAMRREAGQAGISVSEAIRFCVERGWQGFRADWIARAPPSSRAPPSHGRQTANDYLSAELRKIRDGSASYGANNGVIIDASPASG